MRKINALYRASVGNQKHEQKLTGVAVRYGMNATIEEFNKWLTT